MPNCYVPNLQTFQDGAVGSMTAPFIGLNTFLNGAQASGLSTLTVVSSVGVQVGQYLWILDGPNTEQVQASLTAPAPSATTIALVNPTANSHGSGVNLLGPGNKGSLAALFVRASGLMEDFCLQGNLFDRGLYLKSHTEKLEMMTPRAHVDPNYSIIARPRWFPVVSVASAAVEYLPGSSVALSTTALEFDGNTQRITWPQAQTPLGVQSLMGWQLQGLPIQRSDQAWLSLTYTAGIDPTNVPPTVTEAAILFTLELLTYVQNPTGAAIVRRGDAEIIQRLRGRDTESTFDGIFAARAKQLLTPLRARFI